MKEYDDLAYKIFKKIYPYLIQDLKNYYKKEFDNKIIVELGTGPGHVINEILKENFLKVYGIDISLRMLIKTNERYGSNNKLQLINANVESIPLKDSSIDLIISRGSIFFWKNLEKALNETYRILKPNGFALIGGGYGISTPDNVIDEILSALNKESSKKDKPKIDIDSTVKIMEKIGGTTEVIAKPKHGFWIAWRK